MSNLISSINAQPDPNAPDLAAFRQRPAESLHRGDYIAVDSVLYRVEGRQRYKYDPILHRFTLYPVLGGRIVTLNFRGREWLPSYQECP
jgi:hypothetical protein